MSLELRHFFGTADLAHIGLDGSCSRIFIALRPVAIATLDCRRILPKSTIYLTAVESVERSTKSKRRDLFNQVS